jgi:hypothetical protein
VIDTSAGSDASRSLAHSLRRELWAEHLGVDQNDPQLQDPAAGLDLWKATADALDQWHKTGRGSDRPRGQVRRHNPQGVSRLQRIWANPVNRLLIDPDGRPRKMRGTTEF